MEDRLFSILNKEFDDIAEQLGDNVSYTVNCVDDSAIVVLDCNRKVDDSDITFLNKQLKNFSDFKTIHLVPVSKKGIIVWQGVVKEPRLSLSFLL